MTATLVQTFGATSKSYGPFPVTPGPDFDDCGLDRQQLDQITTQAHQQGAEQGYCTVVYHDDNGNELADHEEIAVI